MTVQNNSYLISISRYILCTDVWSYTDLHANCSDRATNKSSRRELLSYSSATYHTRDLINTPGQTEINATLMISKLTVEEVIWFCSQAKDMDTVNK